MNQGPDNPLNESASADNSEDAAFEKLLRSALAARPEPSPPPDLAMRAMALAIADESARGAQRAGQLARQRRWAQIASLAAALLIVALLAGAARRMWTRGDIASIATSASTDASADGSSSETAASDTSSASTSSTTSTIAVVFVAELLVLGIVLMSMSRRAPTMPWGAEALAGFW